MSGQDVVDWQAKLLSMGFDIGPSGKDGRYGVATMVATMEAQRMLGVEADGEVGKNTLRAAEAWTQKYDSWGVQLPEEPPLVAPTWIDLEG